MKKINIITALLILLPGFLQVSGQNDTGLFQKSHLQYQGYQIKSGNQRTGKFVTDSTYDYRANLFGQTWLNTSRYKVTQRDQFGNFIAATNYNYDTLQMNWYAGNTYEASYIDSLFTSTWIANVWDLKVGVWRMSDSIKYLPGGLPEIAWYKAWDPVGYKFLRGKRVSYFYLENGNTEKQFIQAFDTLTRKWKNERQDFYSYNIQDLLQENFVKVWDTLNLIWKNSELINFSYDENDLLIHQINQKWVPASSEWQDNYKADFFYTAEGLPGERFVYQWNDAFDAWINMSHTINLYNESSLLAETLSQYWDEDENIWLDNMKIQYNYTLQGQKNEVIYQFWDAAGYWLNLSRYNYSYDENGNRTEYLFRSWDFYNNIWEDYYKEETWWSEFIQFSVNELWFPEVKIFPNPASDFINLTFETEVKNAFCFLFSDDGKLLKTQCISGNSARINTSGFMPGIYILRIMADGQDFSQKIILK